MDTEDLHTQLREIAGTGAIDASLDRGEIESRARVYRRHRRRVATACLAVGIVGIGALLFVLVRSGDGSESSRITPAQSTPAADAGPSPMTRCLNQQAELASQSGWPAGQVGMYDVGTKQGVFVSVQTYCEKTVALEARSTDPSVSTVIYLENGEIKARAGLPVVTGAAVPPTTAAP